MKFLDFGVTFWYYLRHQRKEDKMSEARDPPDLAS